MIHDDLSAHDIVERGEQLYSDRLKSEMEREHQGEFLALICFRAIMR